MAPTTTSSLLPKNAGHQFVFYGDCCSGIPGSESEKNFAKVNATLRRLDPPPEFILFLGDHIEGACGDPDGVRKQWRYWLDHEMAWLDTDQIPIYHLTSNHNSRDEDHERVWLEVFPDIPQNGPPGQEGFAYWVRREDLLMVMVNTNSTVLGGGHVETEWLDETLTAHRDARHKIVLGHQPVFPVNGYDDRPGWCIVQDDAQAFWSVLVRHKVPAYLCSHIIAFDFQEHDGVAQICSGGAGTNYGPGGFMGEDEYLHFVQAALDDKGLRLQTIDPQGQIREQHAIPVKT